MQEKIKTKKEIETKEANFNFKDVSIIACVIIGMLITLELFQVGFYIVENVLQAFCIYLVNVPFFAYVLFKFFNWFVKLSNRKAKKRG